MAGKGSQQLLKKKSYEFLKVADCYEAKPVEKWSCKLSSNTNGNFVHKYSKAGLKWREISS